MLPAAKNDIIALRQRAKPPCRRKRPLQRVHRRHLRRRTREELIAACAGQSGGLIIFTHGGGELLYTRRGGAVKRLPAFKADVVSTLGAGDTFKAGYIYALYKGLGDDAVRFAATTAAVSRFPIPLNPPTLERIHQIMG